MMNKVFKEEIGDILEVYMDNMIVKYAEENLHESYLQESGATQHVPKTTRCITKHMHRYNRSSISGGNIFWPDFSNPVAEL
jgi:hypothetical protein